MAYIATITPPTSDQPSRAMKALEALHRTIVTDSGGHPDSVPTSFAWTKRWMEHTGWHRFLAFDKAQDAPTNDAGQYVLPGSADSGIELVGKPVAFADVFEGKPTKLTLGCAAGHEDALEDLWQAITVLLGSSIETMVRTAPTPDNRIGDLAYATTPLTQFLSSKGFSVSEGLAEYHLDLTKDFSSVKETLEKHPDYRLVQWNREVPPQYVDSFNKLAQPSPQVLNVASLAPDHRMIVTAAQHIETREIVAYSQMSAIPGTEIVVENATVVHPDHRGRGLALRMRMANIAHVRSLAPEATHAVSHDGAPIMRPIHALLGFTEAATVTTWSFTA